MKDIRGGPAMSTCQGTWGRFESWNPLVQCIIGGNLANSCTLRPVQCYHGFFLHFGGVGVNFDFFLFAMKINAYQTCMVLMHNVILSDCNKTFPTKRYRRLPLEPKTEVKAWPFLQNIMVVFICTPLKDYDRFIFILYSLLCVVKQKE